MPHALFAAANWTMAPIVLCSILLLALAFQRFYVFRRSRLLPAAVVDEFGNLKRGSRPQPDKAREAILGHPGVLAALLQQALQLAGRPAAEVGEALRETADGEILRLRAWNNWFAYAGRVGPLLGLLGLVWGLLAAYAAIGRDGAARGQHMAVEVAANLDATRWGVVIAIVGETLAALFRHRLDRFRADLGKLLAGVADKVSLLDPPTTAVAAPPSSPGVARPRLPEPVMPPGPQNLPAPPAAANGVHEGRIG
jgi:biopolymer transport protein ExbB